MSSTRFFFSTEIPYAFDRAWPYLDYDAPGWTLEGGGAREVGTLRKMEMPEIGLIVDKLLTYKRDDNHATFTYAVVNENNFLRSTGYEGTLTLYRNAANADRSFLHYESRWDSAEIDVPTTLAALMGGWMGQLIEQIEAGEVDRAS